MAFAYDNRITLQKLEVFCTVIELGGFSRAAEHLYLAQPVVTAHVKSLAKRLDVQLMYRDGHRTRPTDAGERVYEWASDVLSNTRELVRDLDGLADGARGSVAVSASMSVGSYLLPPVLSQIREQRPAAEITLYVSDPEGAIANVQSGASDFAVIVGEGTTDLSTLKREVVGREEVVLVAAPDFRPETESITIAELRSLPLVSSPRAHIRRELIDRQLLAEGVTPENIVIELGHPEAMKAATIEGLGACLLFRSAVWREVELGALRMIRLEDSNLWAPLSTFVRKNKRLSPLQSQALEAVRTLAAGDGRLQPAEEAGAEVAG
ncbi:MAG: LysR family transcriptional regulator [Actinobacteria bacterium]|nr:LysR family transcriptional regulator [Actinomycetota bacterium]